MTRAIIGWLWIVFFSSRRRHTRYWRDWSSDVCSSDLVMTDPSSVRHSERHGTGRSASFTLVSSAAASRDAAKRVLGIVAHARNRLLIAGAGDRKSVV